MKILFIAILILLAIYIMPNNGSLPVVDYRDAYLGNFHCVQNFTKGAGQEMCSSSENVIVVVTKDKSDSILIITIDERIFKAKLIGNNLIALPGSGNYGGKFVGNDSLVFSFSLSMAYGCRINGKKQQ